MAFLGQCAACSLTEDQERDCNRMAWRSRTPPLSCLRPNRTKSVPNTGEYTGISRY